MKLGIVIPTYQEEKNIKKIFYAFKKLKNINFFFCFVDGSYTSATSNEIKRYFKKNYKIIYQKKKKIGILNLSTRCEASLLGFKWLIKNKKIDMVSDMDADLSSDPADIYKAIQLYKRNSPDLIIGSKYLKRSKIINRKLSRSFCSLIYSYVCKKLISNKISDYSAGFRFYDVSSLKKLIKIKPLFKTPSQHLQNLLFYYENQLEIKEFPANYIDTDGNSKSISNIHMLVYIFQLTEILLRYHLRKLNRFFK
jgi:glycosyltransferase involved in cell wall biosynthesis